MELPKDSNKLRQKPLFFQNLQHALHRTKRCPMLKLFNSRRRHIFSMISQEKFLEGEMQRIGTDCTFKGEPGIIYSSEETKYLASRLKFSLVGKFSHGLPNLNFLRNRIIKLGLKGTVNVGRLNFKHVLIRLNNEEDFSRLWLRGEWTFDNFHMRVFKWSPDFDPQTESPIAPVWIKLPGLPVHLFEKNALFTFAAKIGKPLRMDEPTADLSRPDLARVCVEIDLTAPKVQTVHLQINGKTYRQQVVYENCPPYCTFCNHLGHDMSACISKHHPGINHTDKEPRPTELLDKDWDAENKRQNAPHFTDIEAEEEMHKESNRDSCPSMVPNSLSEETPSKEVGHTKNFFRGETSKQRHPDNQPPKLIESTGKSTSLAKNSEAGGSKVETQDHRSGENTHQKMILTDSTASHRHKRNKSLEEDMSKASKTGGKDYSGSLTIPTCQSQLRHYPDRDFLRRYAKTGPMDDFNDMMSDTGLIDAGFEGEPFTWTNKRVWRRLDRVLYSKEWAETFNITRVVHLPRRLTKELLKKWNRETFGNVFTTVQQAKQEATDAEKKFDRDPSEANLIALNKSNAVMVHALTLEAEYWKQKSNCKWLEAGERNTKYFHSLVKKKRVKSTIHRIMEGNQEITSPDRIRDSAASYFENLLSGQVTQSSATDFPFQFPKIPEAIGQQPLLDSYGGGYQRDCV
ncbi:UNVERIFIED_CONTAM: hypothetical protein Slati_4223800 [Sesamum latifolium]|uniref:DUF4283 domain-containing protein n=1 Tax=Sesamum latifolium TaxID=2727402 RepID=A0AAW2TAY2_9LAMI